MTKMFAIADRTRLEIGGADRAKFLHNLCTNDVKSLAPGQGCEAFFTNVQGKLLGHCFLFAGAETIVLDTVPGQGALLAAHLERYHVREDVRIRDCTDEWAQVWLLGDGAASLVSPADAARLPRQRLNHAELEIAGVKATAISAGWGAGLWLACPRKSDERLAETLAAAGAQAGDSNELERARIEAGFPHYDRDIGDKNLPQEVDRDAMAISFKKGCYLGQETVARIDALGHVNRLLRRVVFPLPKSLEVGVELFDKEKSVGVVSSLAATDRGAIGLAMLRREAAASGQTLTSSIGEAAVLGRDD